MINILYSKNKRILSFILSVLMTIGLGSSHKNDLINDDFSIQDFYSYIEDEGYFIDNDICRNIIFDSEKLKITDMEDAVWLNLCIKVIIQGYAGQARYEEHIKEMIEEGFYSKDENELKYYMKSSYDEKINSCTIEDIKQRESYYNNILKAINSKLREYDNIIINYVDSNAEYTINWDHPALGDSRNIEKSVDYKLPSYGVENAWISVKHYLSSGESYLSFEIGKFEPYKKFNFHKNDNPIRTKYQNFKEADLIIGNKLKLPLEYAMLPENLIIERIKSQGTKQYPLKGKAIGKQKIKKGPKPSYVDSNITNQYNNPTITNYPLGAVKKRSGYRGK